MAESPGNDDNFYHIQTGFPYTKLVFTKYDRYILGMKLMKLSRSSGATLIDRECRSFTNFYSNSDVLGMLERAPILIQRQYFNSFSESYDYSTLEKFMKLNEDLGYPNINLQDPNGRDTIFLKDDVQSIDSETQSNSESSKRLYSKLLEQKLSRVSYKSSVNTKSNYASADFISPVRKYNVTKFQLIHTTAILLLIKAFSEEAISEIIERAVSEDLDIEIFDIFTLVEKWDDLKDYPLTWSHEVI